MRVNSLVTFSQSVDFFFDRNEVVLKSNGQPAVYEYACKWKRIWAQGKVFGLNEAQVHVFLLLFMFICIYFINKKTVFFNDAQVDDLSRVHSSVLDFLFLFLSSFHFFSYFFLQTFFFNETLVDDLSRVNNSVV